MEALNKLIAGFILLIIGVVLISQIATSTSTVTTKTGVSAEPHAMILTGYPAINTTATYTVTNAPTLGADCPLTNFVLTNQSGTVLTSATDYTVDLTTGIYSLKNTVASNTSLYGAYNKTYATYNYCGTGYVNLDWGRTILNLVGGFFAIALLMVAVGLFYSIARDYGIVGK